MEATCHSPRDLKASANPTLSDAPAIPTTSSQPQNTTDALYAWLDLRVDAYSAAISATENDNKLAEDARSLVESAAQGIMPFFTAKVYGSRGSGLATRNSDTDIVITLLDPYHDDATLRYRL